MVFAPQYKFSHSKVLKDIFLRTLKLDAWRDTLQKGQVHRRLIKIHVRGVYERVSSDTALLHQRGGGCSVDARNKTEAINWFNVKLHRALQVAEKCFWGEWILYRGAYIYSMYKREREHVNVDARACESQSETSIETAKFPRSSSSSSTHVITIARAPAPMRDGKEREGRSNFWKRIKGFVVVGGGGWNEATLNTATWRLSACFATANTEKWIIHACAYYFFIFFSFSSFFVHVCVCVCFPKAFPRN